MGTVFSRTYIKVFRILSSSVSSDSLWIVGVPGAAELSVDSLKLRCCTTPFSGCFLPYSQAGEVFVLVVHQVDGVDMLQLISWMGVAFQQRGSANQEDMSRISCSFHAGSRASNAKAMEKCAFLPNPQGSGARSVVSLPTFLLVLGLVDFAAGEAWNLRPEATGVVFSQLVSPAEGARALPLARRL